jgi:glycosyltransferase involved in cell wall biosynthesis
MEQIEVLSWSHKKAQKGQIDFIYFGRLVAKKGIEFSLEVIAELQRLGLNVHFHIYGSGEEGSSLEEKTKALSIEEYVSFYGAYQRLDILNLLAREQFIFLGGFRALENNDQDGIPNTLLECMSMGCPVVTTDSGSISQLMSSDREALIIPRDKHAAAKMMIELLSNSQELERMVEFARKNTLENFSFEENFKKLLEHF